VPIWDYIAADNPAAADRMDRRFSEAAQRLTRYPYLGRAGKIVGTRELLAHRSYRLLYELYADTIWVLALVHTARQWPPARNDFA